MINHVRTLLLNVERTDADVLGEEQIDPDFKPLDLPSPMRKVRSILFGDDPDRYMLNYRSREILTIVHNTELESWITYFDNRITYFPFRGFVFYDLPSYEQEYLKTGTNELARIGDIEADESAGKLYYHWMIDTDSSQNVTVTQFQPTYRQKTSSYSVSGGRSEPINLIGSGISVTFLQTNNAKWSFTAIAKPRRNLGAIIYDIAAAINSGDEAEIFKGKDEEPVKTYYNVWTQHSSSPMRLAAIVLATTHQLTALL